MTYFTDSSDTTVPYTVNIPHVLYAFTLPEPTEAVYYMK